ncbi:hypothetical protein Nepgr_026439 [Nepenthes gracilis]|uniref:CCHC-type domain-containing protein n=1 Tax=Nepenthes gracilis TaxID=150966 RepID=A0AAD3T8L0_NEPGR|nr:hypothetical protein Nepgr_026439 [Nepenthes gracilis]
MVCDVDSWETENNREEKLRTETRKPTFLDMVISKGQDQKLAFDEIRDDVTEEGDILIDQSGEWPAIIISNKLKGEIVGLLICSISERMCYGVVRRLIGEPIRVDTNTTSPGQGRFAKIVVKIDLGKPLLAKCSMVGEPPSTEYEGIPKICFECGRAGHVPKECKLTPKTSVNRDDRRGNLTTPADPSPKSLTQSKGNEVIGPLLHAPRRMRRPSKGSTVR